MPKAWTVAKTEYLVAVRTKAFIVGVLLTPLLIFGSLMIQKFASKKADIRDQRIAIVDHTGRFWSAIEAAAKVQNDKGIYGWEETPEKKQVFPRFVPQRFDTQARDRKQVELELSERVRGGDLFAFAIIGPGVIDGTGDDAGITYFTNTPTADALPNWLKNTVGEEVSRIRAESAGVDREVIQKVVATPPFRSMGLAKAASDGQVTSAREENRALTFGVPVGAAMLLFMMVMSAAPVLLNAVMEEKIQRISELLISSISPFQLMLGKLMGSVMLAVTNSVLYLGAAVYMLHRYGLEGEVPLSLFAWFALFLVLATLMYGSIFAAIGAACSEIKDAQSMMGPAMILIMIPMFCWFPVFQSPNGPFAVWASLVPTATPILMLMRIATSPGPPAWQVALGLVLTVATTLACVWAGGKVFRIGILSHGQTPGFRKMFGWIFSR